MSDEYKDNETADYEIDHQLRVPEPFDIGVADLKVRNVANAISEGLDFEVTANFGSDYVTIKLDDGGSLEVLCSIYEAHIDTSPINCHFTDIERPEDTSGYEYQHSFDDVVSSAKKTEAGANARGDLELNRGPAKMGLSGNAKKTTSLADDLKIGTQGTKKSNQVQFGPDDIRIRPNPDEMPLEGALVDRAKCLRVAPIDRSKPYGVVLKLRVKRSWMQLSEARAVSLSSKLSGLMKSVLSGTDPSDEYHREAFKLLLDHLVFSGLQNDADDQYATFAAKAIRAVPSSVGDQKTGYLQPSPLNLTLPVDDLETVLSGAANEVRTVLRKHGLDTPEEIATFEGDLVFETKGLSEFSELRFDPLSDLVPTSFDGLYINSWVWTAKGPFAGRDTAEGLYLPDSLIDGMLMQLSLAPTDRAHLPIEFSYSKISLMDLKARVDHARYHANNTPIPIPVPDGTFRRIRNSFLGFFKAQSADNEVLVSRNKDDVWPTELILVLTSSQISIHTAKRSEDGEPFVSNELIRVAGRWVSG
ncbi:MAG: hypothetical protein AB3N12_01575 [Ruegeria sp.]